MKLDADVCMAFEDSENGILASRGANLRTIIAVNDYTKDHDFTGAVLVLDQLGEPGQDFKVLSGDAKGAEYVDIALVEKLMQD
jgi:beta-phosphoglucomutase-like phosphatase (HAD superfamily)